MSPKWYQKFYIIGYEDGQRWVLGLRYSPVAQRLKLCGPRCFWNHAWTLLRECWGVREEDVEWRNIPWARSKMELSVDDVDIDRWEKGLVKMQEGYEVKEVRGFGRLCR